MSQDQKKALDAIHNANLMPMNQNDSGNQENEQSHQDFMSRFVVNIDHKSAKENEQTYQEFMDRFVGNIFSRERTKEKRLQILEAIQSGSMFQQHQQYFAFMKTIDQGKLKKFLGRLKDFYEGNKETINTTARQNFHSIIRLLEQPESEQKQVQIQHIASLFLFVSLLVVTLSLYFASFGALLFLVSQIVGGYDCQGINSLLKPILNDQKAAQLIAQISAQGLCGNSSIIVTWINFGLVMLVVIFDIIYFCVNRHSMTTRFIRRAARRNVSWFGAMFSS